MYQVVDRKEKGRYGTNLDRTGRSALPLPKQVRYRAAPHPAGSTRRCAGAKSISPGQEAPGRPDRPAAVVHARFLLGCELGEGATERRVEEERIVAEAVVSTRRVGDHAFGDALRRVLPAGGVHDGDHAAEARRPLLGRDTTERLEEEGAPGRVVEPGAAEPRGANAGRSPERVHLDAGIVAEGPRPDEPRGGARFSERVGAVGVARLLREPGAR